MTLACHPGAWWVWALGVAVAATLTTNLFVLALLVAVVCLVVAVCRAASAPTSFKLYLWVAAGVVVVRLIFRVVFPSGAGDILFTLPTLTLGPLELFGVVTVQAVASGLTGGLQLAVIILAIGAAHTLADLLGLLKHAPPAIAGLSTAVLVAVSTFPALGRSVVEVRRAARLRGRKPGLRRTVIPVLEGTMDRSLDLAAAMEARGYGGRPARGTPRPRLHLSFVVAALGLVALATYALFDDAWPGWVAPTCTVVALGLGWGALRTTGSTARTIYRPDRWTWASSGVAASGILCAVGLALVPTANRLPPASLRPEVTVLALLAALLAALPILLTGRRTA